MSTFTTTLSSIKEGKQVLQTVYNSDSSATYCGKDAVIAPSITARLTVNKSYFLVTLSSNYYYETTLKEIVQSALQLN